jgi:hypothetical protein
MDRLSEHAAAGGEALGEVVIVDAYGEERW